MKILVPIKLVPDLVEELEIDDTGKALDMTWLSLIISEYDDHAIEQAILMKEAGEAEVIIAAPDLDEVDDILFAASAKGADRIIKLEGLDDLTISNLAIAKAMKTMVDELMPDIILTGVQAHNDLDGQLGPILAEVCGLPYVGYVSGAEAIDGGVHVSKEFPGGVIAKMLVKTPCVLGIQAAAEPPRYVAFSKIRQASQSAEIEGKEAEAADEGRIAVEKLYQPEVLDKAEMIDGDADEVAVEFIRILRDKDLL